MTRQRVTVAVLPPAKRLGSEDTEWRSEDDFPRRKMCRERVVPRGYELRLPAEVRKLAGMLD
jgi:hypothetical protein